MQCSDHILGRITWSRSCGVLSLSGVDDISDVAVTTINSVGHSLYTTVCKMKEIIKLL